jgi:hypothetical protein
LAGRARRGPLPAQLSSATVRDGCIAKASPGAGNDVEAPFIGRGRSNACALEAPVVGGRLKQVITGARAIVAGASDT